MENKSVAIVSRNENGFLTHSLCDNLNASGIKTYSITLENDTLIKYIVESCDLLIIMEDVNLSMFSQQLTDIKNMCYELKKSVVIYANPEPIEKLKRIFPESMIAATFVRPMDIPSVIEKMEKIFEEQEARQQRKKILVVDDSGAMLRTIMGWLENTYQVSLANSAAKAFTVIEKEMPDLILLDYEMPICSGAQFFEMLAGEESTKNIPVIFLTARDDAQTVREVLDLKPQGYILKTTPEEKVLRIIGDFFERNR